MTPAQSDRFLEMLKKMQADVAEIKTEIALIAKRLRALDDLFVAFRTDHHNAQA